MTDEQISQDKVPQPPQPDSSFWSPWAIFFFGVCFAALNWWRMGNKRKAIFFLAIFAFLELVYEWLTIRRLFTYSDFGLVETLLVVQLLARVAFQTLLMEVMRVDIRKFQELGKAPIPTRWTIIFRFFIAVLVPVLAINYTFYFLPRTYGLCAFPRAEDLIYRLQVANRVGPEKVLVNQNDFGCEWLWLDEWIKTQNTKGVLQTYLIGDYRDPDREHTGMSVDQSVYLFDGPVTKEQFENFLARDDIWPSRAVLNDWPLINIPTHGASVELSEGHCKDKSAEIQVCAVYLVNQTMIVRLLFEGDAGYDRYMDLSTQKVAERMLQYAKSP